MTTRTHPLLTLTLLLAVLLAACAPSARTVTPHESSYPPIARASDYHPHEPGTTLTYFGEDSGTYTLRTLAPRLLDGTPHQQQHLTGPDLDEIAYRTSSEQGVFLHRIDTGSTITTFDPPILELPGPGRLSVGLKWGGETTTRTYARTETPAGPNAEFQTTYLHQVTDMRNIRISGEQVTAFLVSSEFYENQQNHIDVRYEERWYAPYFGDAHTRHGLRLRGATLD